MLTVGEILKKEREKKGISFADVEKNIRVREKFLEAIEDNNWSSFTSKIYIAGIVKNYARFLGLDTKKVLAFFRREYDRQEDTGFKERIRQSPISETRRKFVIGFSLVLFLFLIYFSYQLKVYFSPPKVKIISPTQTKFKNEEKIKIVGKSEKEAQITIYGMRVYQNSEGVFEYDFPLKKGRNELIIEMIGANGRKAVFKKTYLNE